MWPNSADLHPNYWAQLALRNCLTQAYNSGTPKGGTSAPERKKLAAYGGSASATSSHS